MDHAATEMSVASAAPKPEVIRRHSLLVRITHWINVLCLAILLMSGLQIFNAHPALYWGHYGADADTPFIAITSGTRGGKPVGMTTVAGISFNTTGVLGVSHGRNDRIERRAFPHWITLPSWQDLATGRRWHFFFAWIFVLNGLVYLIAAAAGGHLRRDLAPRPGELSPKHILADIWDHMRLKFPRGEAAKRYNILQKLAYLSVLFVLLPLMALTGMTMSPGANAAFPLLLDMFGGRQSARTLHFIVANLLILFLIVHIVEAVLAGFWNELRSMITGRYRVRPEEPTMPLSPEKTP